MLPVDPTTNTHLLPPGCEAVKYAEHQPEYLTLPSLRTPDGRVLSQWKPDANELALLNNGVPVTLVMHTFGDPLQPVQLGVGGMDLR